MSGQDAFDVAIIGAGVVGAAIAAELSRFELRVLWLEAAHDVAEGASKANSAIACSGYDADPGTLEAELITESSPDWEGLCASLDVPFRRIGALVLALDDQQAAKLPALATNAAANGVETELIDPKDIPDLAPAATRVARGALSVPAEGIIDPIRLTIAWAELAVRRGVELRTSTPATGFRHDEDGAICAVKTPSGVFQVHSIVNASGLGADRLSESAGAEQFRLWPRKGEFLLVDRAFATGVDRILVPIPSDRTRGILVVPTTNGTLLLGPTADDRQDRDDRSTDEDRLAGVLESARRLMPGLAREHVIKAFAGLRPAADRLYMVECSKRVSNLVHAAGIRSTGVSSSPGIARRVRALLAEAGVSGSPRRALRHTLPRVPRIAELDAREILDLTAREPAYRTVVCACEHVSAAEIQAALSAPLAARSLDGVRKRTRAMAGRCQGAYCQAGVGFLLSQARGQEPWQVAQGEPGSTWGIRDV